MNTLLDKILLTLLLSFLNVAGLWGVLNIAAYMKLDSHVAGLFWVVAMMAMMNARLYLVEKRVK